MMQTTDYRLDQLLRTTPRDVARPRSPARTTHPPRRRRSRPVGSCGM